MTDSLLTVRDLVVDFDVDRKVTHAVRGVSFDIARGETVGLVGESGSGKSVSALSIMRLLPKPAARDPSGEIRFADEGNLLALSEQQMRAVRGNQISMIFQEPLSALNPLHSVEKQIGEVLDIHQGLSGASARQRVLELMHLVGLPEPEKRLRAYPHQLSGGQRQRVMIAMALANDPALLIADEPTTALDVTVQAQILELLQALQAKLGMAILLITHDLGIVRKMADRVCVMTDGRIVESGNMARVFEQPQHEYTRHLLAAEPKGKPPPPDDSQPILVRAQSLKVWFPIRRGVLRRTVDHIKAVDDVSFTVEKAQILGLVGESGSGKSQLFLAALGLLASNGRVEGSVRYRDTELSTLSQAGLNRVRGSRITMIFQDPLTSLTPHMRIGDQIVEALKVHQQMSQDEATRRAVESLELVRIPEARRRLRQYPHELSGGMQQRVGLARALANDPQVLLMDEAFSALDPLIRTEMQDELLKLQDRHERTIVFISHDLDEALRIGDRIAVMEGGRVVQVGTPEEILQNPADEYVRAFSAGSIPPV